MEKRAKVCVLKHPSIYRWEERRSTTKETDRKLLMRLK